MVVVLIAIAVYIFSKKLTTGTDNPPPVQSDTVRDTAAVQPQVPLDEEKESTQKKAVEIDATADIADFGMKLRSTKYYKPPLHGKMTLSGSFGELRNNHFHAGLDIRTGGMEGQEVHASAAGYVSRIRVSERGYGKALYIQHPNGTSTVYGHLQRFAGDIQVAVEKEQYRRESYEMDYYPKAGALPVTQDQVVALSGNTGGSGGPHLHFEIRDGKSGHTVNPLLYGMPLEDIIAPVIKGLQIYKLDENQRGKSGTYDWHTMSSKENEITLKPGRYGLGVSWVEYFSDRMNRLGVNYAALAVDGKRIFSQEMESFSFDQGRYINQHLNFYEFYKSGRRYVKMFRDRGNPLHFYKGSGAIELVEGDEKKVTVVIKDFAGHATSREVVLKCVEEKAIALSSGDLYAGRQRSRNQTFTMTSDNGKVVVPAGTLYNDFVVDLSEQAGSGTMASNIIRVGHPSIPLHKRVEVFIKPKAGFEPFRNKLMLMEYDPKTRSSSAKGAVVQGEYVTYKVKSFGMFYLALDTIPPKLTLTSNGRSIVARAVDLTSDITYYRGELDGKWLLFEYEYKYSSLTAKIPATIPSGKHVLTLVVRDEVGNEVTVKKDLEF